MPATRKTTSKRKPAAPAQPSGYKPAADHVNACPEVFEVRERVGVCLVCDPMDTGEVAVTYEQRRCPHAVLVLGTCEVCGANYDRAGWIQPERG